MQKVVDFFLAHYADLRIWLGLLLLLLAVQTWIGFSKVFRRDPPGFVWRTFMDDRGVPDGKIIAVCHSLVVMTATMVFGFAGIFMGVANPWPPWYVWASWEFIAIAGLFGVVYATKKYYENGGSVAPAPDFGLTAPTANPATSTTLSDAPGAAAPDFYATSPDHVDSRT